MRLWRGAHHGGAALALLAATLSFGGCSFSYQLGSLFEKEEARLEQTGSIGSAASSDNALPPESDLVYAKAAAKEVLSRGGKDTSVPWENPRTGARGTVTPIAAAYNQDGLVCRDFLASYVRSGTEAWMQGEACRVHKGQWEVRKLTPWKRA